MVQDPTKVVVTKNIEMTFQVTFIYKQKLALTSRYLHVLIWFGYDFLLP